MNFHQMRTVLKKCKSQEEKDDFGDHIDHERREEERERQRDEAREEALLKGITDAPSH